MRHALCIIALTLVSVPAIAGDGPKVGVALSGGGARGFAHIGVLKVLEEVGMPIDAVTGASIGAVLGGLYAAGYSAAEIEQIALSENWLELIVKPPSRRGMNFIGKRWNELYFLSLILDGWSVRVPSALRSGQEITDLLTRLTFHVHDVDDFSKLPIPFNGVALDLVTGEAVVLDRGSLPAAMRASMSFQSVFPPVEMDGRLLVDGGLVRDLPAIDALNLGADLVIGIDVSVEPKSKEELDSLLDVANQMVLLTIADNTLEQAPYCRLLIRPDLGKMEINDFDQVQQAIDLGEVAARAQIDDLRALADSVTALAGPASRPIRAESAPVSVAAIELEGLETVSADVVRKELKLTPPAVAGAAEIQQSIRRLYSTDYFDTVQWRVDGPRDAASLRLQLAEKHNNRFRVGLRFDSDAKATILLNTTFRNVGRRTSILQFDVALGESNGVVGSYITHTGLLRSLGLGVSAGVKQPIFDLREPVDGGSSYDATYWSGEVFFGTLYSDWLNVGLGGRAERIDLTRRSGGAPADSTEILFPLFGALTIDTLDETIYPESGLLLNARGSVASEGVGSDVSFGRALLDWRLVLPVGDRVSILQNLYLGSSVDDLPVAYQYYLGGVHRPWTFRGRSNTFLGVPPDALVGRHAQHVALGLQWRVFPPLFIQALWNSGNVFDEWSMKLSRNDYVNGGGVVFGSRFLNARIEVSFGASELDDFVSHITVGNHF